MKWMQRFCACIECDCLCMFGSSVVLPGHLHNVLKQELLHRERQTRDVDHWTVVWGLTQGNGWMIRNQWTCKINAEQKFFMSFGGLHTKISRKLLCVESGTHEDDLEIISEAEQVLHNHKQNVRLQVPLVDLVQHQVADTGQQSDTHKKRKWFKSVVDFRFDFWDQCQF